MTQVVKPNFSNSKINANQKSYNYTGSVSETNLQNNTAIFDMSDYELKDKTYVDNTNSDHVYETSGNNVSAIEGIVNNEEKKSTTISDAVRENQEDVIRIIKEATKGDGLPINKKQTVKIGKTLKNIIREITNKIKKRIMKKYNKYNGDNYSIPFPKYAYSKDEVIPDYYPYGPDGEVVVPGYSKTSYYDKDGTLVGYLISGIYTKIDTKKTQVLLELVKNYRYDKDTGTLRPISIFDEENIASSQYGGNQNILDNMNMGDQKDYTFFRQEMQGIAPYENFESKKEAHEYYKEYAKFLPYSCGYISATNTIFANYIGREEEFAKHFGFPMYTIDKATGAVEYNYEQLELQFFNYVNGDKIKNIIANGGANFVNGHVEDKNGEKIYLGYDMQDFENFAADHGVNCKTQSYNINLNYTSENEKDVNKILRKAYLNNDSIILSAGGYDLYDESGKLVYEGGGSHSMQLVGFNEKGQPIVSSWGEKFILDANGEAGGNNEVDYLGLAFTTVNFDNKRKK